MTEEKRLGLGSEVMEKCEDEKRIRMREEQGNLERMEFVVTQTASDGDLSVSFTVELVSIT